MRRKFLEERQKLFQKYSNMLPELKIDRFSVNYFAGDIDNEIGFGIHKVPGKITWVCTPYGTVLNSFIPIRNTMEYLLDPNCTGATLFIDVKPDINIIICFDLLDILDGNSLMIISVFDEYEGLIFDTLACKFDIICMFYIRLLSFAKQNVEPINYFYYDYVKPAYETDLEFINFFPKAEFFLSKIKSPLIEAFLIEYYKHLTPYNQEEISKHLNINKE